MNIKYKNINNTIKFETLIGLILGSFLLLSSFSNYFEVQKLFIFLSLHYIMAKDRKSFSYNYRFWLQRVSIILSFFLVLIIMFNTLKISTLGLIIVITFSIFLFTFVIFTYYL
jgi:hypothetical protein